MKDVTHYPLLVFALTLVGLWLSAWVGRSFLRHRSKLDEEMREDFGIILGATLTMLGLLIGFSFSMAMTRYDLRKSYEETEANAIGTEYVRADLLPAADGNKLRTLLPSYLDQRIAFYQADDQELKRINSRTIQLQSELWSAVEAPAATRQTPIIALAVSGMNDVLNAQGYTQAGFWNRIPTAAWGLMACIAVCCNLLIGYGSKGSGARHRLLAIIPLLVAIAFMLIADIDSPRHGIIRVMPHNLISLHESMHP